MKVLVVDVGGSSVKMLASGERERRRFESGEGMTPSQMLSRVKELTEDWTYDVVSIGYPGIVKDGQPVEEPLHLAPGWVGFDYGAGFARPVKILNDAAMQALGSYRGGVMLFLGFGTGLGSAMVAEDTVVPLELGRLAYVKGKYDDHVGSRALKEHGLARWRKHVLFGIERFVDALLPDEVVLGGGNVRELDVLPPKCRLGDNANAFIGGFRMWETTRSREQNDEGRYHIPTTGYSSAAPRPADGWPSSAG
jgi:polyphosphate glucokinase